MHIDGMNLSYAPSPWIARSTLYLGMSRPSKSKSQLVEPENSGCPSEGGSWFQKRPFRMTSLLPVPIAHPPDKSCLCNILVE